jgi:hypothetical protein
MLPALALAVVSPALARAADGDDAAATPSMIGGLHFGSGFGTIETDPAEGVFTSPASTPDDWSVGASMTLSVGYRTLHRNYVELVTAFWFGSLDGDLGSEEWIATFAGGAFRFYPGDVGLMVRTGFGGGFLEATMDTPGGEVSYNDFGMSALASIGYETKITERVRVGPVVDAMYTNVGDGVSSFHVLGSLGVTWR